MPYLWGMVTSSGQSPDYARWVEFSIMPPGLSSYKFFGKRELTFFTEKGAIYLGGGESFGVA